MSWWPAAVFGWPAILLAIVPAVVGVSKKSWVVMAPSVVIATPFSLYLAGTPGGRWFGLAILMLLIGATGATACRRGGLAWLLLVPVLAVVGFLAIVVVNQ